MKKALIVATVYKFLNFEKNDIKILKELGYEVHCATNMNGENWLKDDGSLDELGLIKHQIDFGRSPFSKNSIIAYKQLKKLLKQENFQLMHCHTPVAAAIARCAAAGLHKSNKIKVIYTCHGFHFHKTSGIKTWLLYYPVEYVTSFVTDMIITINHEDYEVIQKFPVKYKEYIPGVGIDYKKISECNPDSTKLREEYGIPNDAFLILSIGELSYRKNQSVIIRALGKLCSEGLNPYYLICGTGKMRDEYEQLAKDCGIEHQVIFAGQQNHDRIIELCHCCDVGALTSRIEGLGLAGLEVMAAGRPILGTNIHGIKDYAINGETGFSIDPDDIEGFAKAIKCLIEDSSLRKELSIKACIKAKEFDITISEELMKKNYLAFN